jgi:lipopolysaccharide export system permease protein
MVAMFILEMQFIWLYLDDIMGKGLGIWVIAKLLIFASARIVNMALPLAILMSSIMTVGALSENNELTAMKSAGASLFRILRPLIVFHLLLSLGAFFFANNLWPIANLKFRTLLFSIMEQRPALNLNDGVFYNGIEGISIRVARNDKETGQLTDILIYDHRIRDKGNRTVIRAKSGQMEQTADKRFLVLTLLDGHTYDEQMEKEIRGKARNFPLVSSSFEKTTLRLDLSAFAFKNSDEEVFRNSFEMMTVNQLETAIDSLESGLDTAKLKIAGFGLSQFHFQSKAPQIEAPNISPQELINSARAQDYNHALISAKEATKRGKDQVEQRKNEILAREKFLVRHEIEFHRKFFLAVICMVLFFVGAPLGAIIRKGGLGLPTVFALALFILYELLSLTGERMAKNLIVTPFQGMWMSTLVLLPLSLWITYKATREAQMLDKDVYLKFFRRLGILLRIKKKPMA